MGKVVLNLLGSLNISKLKADLGYTVSMVINFGLLIFLELLNLKTHITTNSTYPFIFLHVLVHLEKGKTIWF